MLSLPGLAVVLAAALCLPVAQASGTLGAAGGDPYALGKRVYLQRIACSDCAAAGGAKDAGEARALIARIERDEFGLAARQRRAVIAYLERRWRLQ